MRTFKVAALILVAVSVVGYAQSSRPKKDDDSSKLSRWINQDNDHKRMVEIRGDFEFTEDYTDVKNVSPGGYVRVEESRGGQSQRYDVRHDAGGPITRVYYKNGKEQPLDQAARDWVSKTILNAVRQSGLDADRRVQILLRQKGVPGVLAEIDQITGDYGRRLYFQGLLKYGALDGAQLRDFLNQAARQLESDYEQAELLIGVAGVMMGKEEASKAFFNAVSTVNSDYERARVLLTVLEKHEVTPVFLADVADSTRRINSDYEKARVLKQVAKLYLNDDTLRAVYFKVIATIQSDYEHRSVLSALLKRGNLSDVVVDSLIESSARMSSDYEKATVLLEVSRLYNTEPRVRNAVLKVVETMNSDYERGRVLSALLKNKQIG